VMAIVPGSDPEWWLCLEGRVVALFGGTTGSEAIGAGAVWFRESDLWCCVRF